MAKFTDEIDFPIECPECGHKFKKSFTWINRCRNFSCPKGCGATFSFSGSEIDQINRDFEKMQKEIKKLNKSFTINL